MKSFLINSLSLLLLVFVITSCSDTQKTAGSTDGKTVVKAYDADVDNPLIIKTLDDFKEMARSTNGTNVSKIVMKPTLDYYDGLRTATLTENKEQIQARSFVEQVIIMRTRILADMAVLKKLDSLQYIEYVYRSGYVDKSSIEHHGLGEITYDEATKEAKAQAVINGEAQDAFYTFKKVDGVWRIDISQVIPLVNQAMEDDITGNGGSVENMLRLTLLSANSGQELPKELWSPKK
jgi:hypothetical protein